MDDGLVKNTLAFWFPPKAPAPSVVEVARFVKTLDADLDTMDTSYKISEERCVCVKFKSHNAMQEALAQNPEILVFRYSNGETVEVKMTVAGSCTKYVRIFDLPPEIPDSEISAVLNKYGSVKRMVREKFPAELGLNMFTGVRGVYLEIKREVPATFYIRNRKARTHYEGLRQKCFLCKEEGHLKVDCPQKGNKSVASRLEHAKKDHVMSAVPVSSQKAVVEEEDDLSVVSFDTPTYSGVVCGTKPAAAEENVFAKMVTLVSDRNKAALPHTPVESGENMVTEEEDAGKSSVKRQHSSGDSADPEEDEEGFKKVEGNRKSSRFVKKVVTPLGIISNGSVKKDKYKRSSSK